MPDLGRVSHDRRDRRSTPARAYVAVKQPLARRSRALHLPHARLRQDVDEDRDRHPADTTTFTRSARIRTRRGLLYAGTQHGVYQSYDDGDRVESLSLNLPDARSRTYRRGKPDLADLDARPRVLHPRRHRDRSASPARMSARLADVFLYKACRRASDPHR